MFYNSPPPKTYAIPTCEEWADRLTREMIRRMQVKCGKPAEFTQ